VIDSLCDQARGGGLAVAWSYCDFLAPREQTVVNIIGAILKRLVGRQIPKNIREAYHEGRRPLLADLKRILKVAIALLPQVYICIDALDECLPRDLPKLLESLEDIVKESPRTRIFLTGRPHVKEVIQRYLTKVVAVSISPKPGDIKNYLEMRLDRDDEPEAMTEYLKADIVRVIMKKMSKMGICIPPLSMMYIHWRIYVDSSSFHSTLRLFWARSQLVREERNLKRWREEAD